jgi:hypothetical protein
MNTEDSKPTPPLARERYLGGRKILVSCNDPDEPDTRAHAQDWYLPIGEQAMAERVKMPDWGLWEHECDRILQGKCYQCYEREENPNKYIK